MNVLFLTSGPLTPATRFRILQYVPALRERGIRCVVSHSRPAKYEAYPWLGWRLSERVRRFSRRMDVLRARFGQFDAAVIEREVFTGPSTEIEEALRPHVDRVILDVDDGIFLEEPQKFTRLAELADVIVCGNSLIADHFRLLARSVVTIPTVIDTGLYPAKEEFSESCVLGWTGTSSNLRYLLRLKPVIRSLALAREVRLQVVADRADGLEELAATGADVRFTRWNPDTEIADLTGFEIGLMPLPDEPWARYKCGLKVIQYFGLGIPSVASPVGANVQLIRDGENGCLAATDDEWTQRLNTLMDDPQLRRQIGSAGRKSAEEQYSVAVYAEHWAELLRGA